MRMYLRGPFPVPLRGRRGPAASGLPPADLGLDVMHDRPDSKSFRGLRGGHVAASAPAEPSVAGDGLFHSTLTVPKALGDLTRRGHAGIVPPATAGPIRAARGLPNLGSELQHGVPGAWPARGPGHRPVQLRGRGAPDELLQAACQATGTAPDPAAAQPANAQPIVSVGLGLGDKGAPVGIVVASPSRRCPTSTTATTRTSDKSGAPPPTPPESREAPGLFLGARSVARRITRTFAASRLPIAPLGACRRPGQAIRPDRTMPFGRPSSC